MNPDDIDYLTSEADRGGNLGDVLQVFVNDFTLRQGAGEAKVREVEMKIGGVTSELFVLHKLLQDFKVRVNDDHDIIMRLQHEIEALQNRVRSLDSRHASVETQSGRLDLRIEQLREQLDHNCQDSQHNVSRLLGNFAKANLANDNNNARSNAANNRDSRHILDHAHQNNHSSDKNEDNSKESLQEAVTNSEELLQEAVTNSEESLQEAVTNYEESLQEAVTNSNDSCDTRVRRPSDTDSLQQQKQPLTFPQEVTTTTTTTTEVPNEEFQGNGELHFIVSDDDEDKDNDNQTQCHSLCDESDTPGEGSPLEQQTLATREASVAVAESTVAARDSCTSPLQYASDDVTLCNNNNNAAAADNDDDDGSNVPSLQDDYDGSPVEASDSVEDVAAVDIAAADEQTIEAEVSATVANSISQDASADLKLHPREHEEEKEKEEEEDAAVALASCNVPLQASEAADDSSFQATTTTTRKNKSKRSRGRKRKDSQNTSEGQQINSVEVGTTVSQAALSQVNHCAATNSSQNSSNSSQEQSSATIGEQYGEQESSTTGTNEVCAAGTCDQVQTRAEFESPGCIENKTSCNSREEESLLTQHVEKDRSCQCSNEQNLSDNDKELITVPIDGEQSPQSFTEEQPLPMETSEETSLAQQNFHQNAWRESDQESPILFIDQEEQKQPISQPEYGEQCHENSILGHEEYQPYYEQQQPDNHYEKQTIQRSFNISVEQTQGDSGTVQGGGGGGRIGGPENMSPQSRRRVTFQEEIDDDEIPDLSDVDGLTEEERKFYGNTPEENNKQKTQRMPGENRIEIKSPSGETTNLQPLRPRMDYRRMESEATEEQKDEIVGICANCSNLAKLRCGNCRQAFYCKRECQRDHWKSSHKDQCRPYQLLECHELGRYIVASRDLKAGDVILKEDPVVVGPKQITEPLCLGCYKRVDGSYRCQKCHWPLCGPQCEKSLDHQPECIVGAEIGSPIEISNFDESNHFYEVVFPLRCLALKKKSPKKYEQLVGLDSHYEDRKGTHVYVENQKSIVSILRNYFFLQQFPIEDIDSSEKSIHNVTGIIDVNALEIRLPDSEVLGLFPNFAMMEHSCTPNTKHSFTPSRQVILKAAVDIKRGEHLSTMYTHILWGTLARRDHIKHIKYFMCTCFRCSDPTELGTNFSTIRCQRCDNGFMLSAAPLDELADWLCTSCNDTIKNEEVTNINLKLGEEIERALAAPTVASLEELLQKHARTTVHPNHYHLFATRHTLLQMYGRDPAHANEDYMKKKERMCQDFLKVCTALDPGMSRLAPYAGVALYEYHLAVLSRTRQDPEARQTDSGALKKDVETAKALLQQCIRVLQDEPKDQPEGQLCHVAQQNLIELRQWEANLFSP